MKDPAPSPAAAASHFGSVELIPCKGAIKTAQMQCKRDVRGLVYCKTYQCWASSNCDTCPNTTKLKRHE